ncbi:hypothetical protein G6016_08880 [Dietzia aerolata]|uniref:PepSY domain-containing protein n=1 Tax=Dietzia aerolata TaxID=595984 RepID=A0ABV5JTB2_9ACTN|nr:hypothetical protein [Dietzia aerolata]MBB0969070.1 hypothetical protein [Dietzia aerolata]
MSREETSWSNAREALARNVSSHQVEAERRGERYFLEVVVAGAEYSIIDSKVGRIETTFRQRDRQDDPRQRAEAYCAKLNRETRPAQ